MRKRAIDLKNYFLLNINPIVRFLIISDIVIVGASGLLGPIFALFISNFIIGGNEAVAGVAAAIYLVTKSVFQIPAAAIIDKIRGEKDDFYSMFIFTLIMSLLPLAYLYIRTPLMLYLIQFLLGLFTAFTFPSYMAIFTRHIDKHKEGTEWGVYFTLTDLISAALAGIGGYIALTLGFHVLIVIMCALSVLGSLALWPVKSYLKV